MFDDCALCCRELVDHSIKVVNYISRSLVVIVANVNNDIDVFIHFVVFVLQELFGLDFGFVVRFVVVDVALIFFVHQAGLYMLVNLVEDFRQQIGAEHF